MPSIINVLDDTQRREFDKPPKFTYPQRKIMFSLPEWAETEKNLILDPMNKLGFIIQLGYFKASGRFFKTETFIKEDIGFISRVFKLNIEHSTLKISVTV